MRSLFPCCGWRVACLVAAASFASTASCQEDLFGLQPDSVVPGSATQPADQPDGLEQQWLGSADRGNQQMGKAIASLARIGRWTQVNRLLEGLATKTPDAESLLEIQKQIEPAEFLEMKLSDQLTEKSRSALDKIATAANRRRQSPKLLRAAISQLDDDSTDRRLSAARTLIEGENASIVALVAAVVAAEPPADRTVLLRALLRQGSGGIAALKQVALYGKPSERTGAIESLGLIDLQANAIDLMTAFHADQATPAERAVASRQLSRLSDTLFDRDVAIAELVADLDEYHRLASRIDNDDQVVTYWSIGSDREVVQFAKTSAIYVAYRNAADAAARLRRVAARSPSVVTKSLVADLAYRLIVDPEWGEPEQAQKFLGAYGDAIDTQDLSRTLMYAIQTDDEPAIVGLLRLIQLQNWPAGSNERLLGMGSGQSPLVVAAASPHARVRYEAALAATRLAGEAGYAGSSQVKQVLSEMVRLGDLPTAIIVETRPEVIAPIQQVVGRLGYRTTVVHSVAQLQQCVALGGDIRMIVTKTQLSDSPPIELIDVIRRTSRGSRLPIVMYGVNQVARKTLDPDLHGTAAARWKSPTEWIEQPMTTAAYLGILDRIERQRRLPPLSSIDRQRFRREASAILRGSELSF